MDVKNQATCIYRMRQLAAIGPLLCVAILSTVGCAGLKDSQRQNSAFKNSNLANPPVAPVNHEVAQASAAQANAVQPGAEFAVAKSTHLASDQVVPVGLRHRLGCRSCGNSNCNGNICSTCQSCSTACQTPGGPCYHPEEYIYDGGDTSLGVLVRKDWSAAGIDPTDTIAYYETESGRVCVVPTNRVPIYAPRFGAVRQVSGAHLAERSSGPVDVQAPLAASNVEHMDVASNVVLPQGPRASEQINLLDAFQENNRGIPIAQVLPLLRLSEARVPHEVFDFFTTGLLSEKDIPVLGRILAQARVWFSPEAITVLVDEQEVAITRNTQLPQEVLVYDTPDGCTLRICKAASHTIVNSGDVVSFTIRFDNIGVKPISNVVIADSLTARLEYIKESQQCSIDAQFASVPNDVGSSALRWEITELKGGEGGVISFDCKVR